MAVNNAMPPTALGPQLPSPTSDGCRARVLLEASRDHNGLLRGSCLIPWSLRLQLRGNCRGIGGKATEVDRSLDASSIISFADFLAARQADLTLRHFTAQCRHSALVS